MTVSSKEEEQQVLYKSQRLKKDCVFKCSNLLNICTNVAEMLSLPAENIKELESHHLQNAECSVRFQALLQ